MSVYMGVIQKSSEVSGGLSEALSTCWLRPSWAWLAFCHMDESTDQLV